MIIFMATYWQIYSCSDSLWGWIVLRLECIWLVSFGLTWEVVDLCMWDLVRSDHHWWFVASGLFTFSMIHHYLFIHSHLLVSMHGDPSPLWDIHTSPLGLLLVWSFLLTIRRHWAGLAGGISGRGLEEQKLEVQSTLEQPSSTQGSNRSSEGQCQPASRVTYVFVREWLESVSILLYTCCIFVAHCRIVYVMYFI